MSVLPALFQASMLALLSTSIPFTTTITSTLIAVNPENGLISDPSLAEVEAASSLHVFVFSAHGDCLIMESDGNFDLNIWETAHSMAARICNESDGDEPNDTDMDSDAKEPLSLAAKLKDTMQAKVSANLRWKDHSG